MSSWAEFLENIETVIDELFLDGCDIPFFRGQNFSWDLQPSLLREDYKKVEGLLYYDFVSYSGPLFKNKMSSWDILFEMRHAGLPTRLLDWSENFAVALYFALRGEPTDPCIWILDPFKLNKASNNEDGILNPLMDLDFDYFGAFIDKTETGVENPLAIFPTKQSSRVFAQKGVFTLHGTKDDPLNKLYPDCTKKISIPTEAFDEAHRFLYLAGINEYSVFPDFDGLARFLKKRHC